MSKKKSPTMISSASPSNLQKAKLVLEEKLLTVAEKSQTLREKIEEDKTFLAETPKQIKTRDQSEKDFQKRLAASLKEQEEDAQHDARVKFGERANIAVLLRAERPSSDRFRWYPSADFGVLRCHCVNRGLSQFGGTNAGNARCKSRTNFNDRRNCGSLEI